MQPRGAQILQNSSLAVRRESVELAPSGGRKSQEEDSLRKERFQENARQAEVREDKLRTQALFPPWQRARRKLGRSLAGGAGRRRGVSALHLAQHGGNQE